MQNKQIQMNTENVLKSFIFNLKGSSDGKFIFIWCLHINVSLQCVDTTATIKLV